MYKAFFHLNRSPFNLTPDPSCFVPTARHNEALAALYYGVRQHKGFVVVTGEVGTGKTLLLRCLLDLFKESKEVAYAYLFNSRLTSTEFLQYIVSDFGLPPGKNKCDMLLELSHFLISRGAKKQTTVLIVDEAHHLSADTLEEIRLLSNLETNDDKLLQIVLVGQPELDEILDSVGLRQLKQRIAIRARIEPLDAEETTRYIRRRLLTSGARIEEASLFTGEAIAKIQYYSKGIPRLINQICENSLITAYARQLEQVTAEIVEETVVDFRLGDSSAPGTSEASGFFESDFQQSLNAHMGVYAAPRSTGAIVKEASASGPFEERKHEPHI
jgi:general secretion pathway protein A